MFSYDIINSGNFLKIDKKIINKIFKEIAVLEKKEHFGILNIIFVGDDEIRKLNKDYRNIDKITDVLSFHYYDNFDKLKSDEIAGEIILSKNKIIEQANEYNHSNEFEFYKLLIHSIFHILGYDHIEENDYKIMNSKEKIIWEKVI